MYRLLAVTARLMFQSSNGVGQKELRSSKPLRPTRLPSPCVLGSARQLLLTTLSVNSLSTLRNHGKQYSLPQFSYGNSIRLSFSCFCSIHLKQDFYSSDNKRILYQNITLLQATYLWQKWGRVQVIWLRWPKNTCGGGWVCGESNIYR